MSNTKGDLVENGVSSISQSSNNEKKPFLSYRWTLVGLTFGFFFGQVFIRTSFSVSLVAMVNTTQSKNESDYDSDVCPAVNSTNADGSVDPQESQVEYNWSNTQQGIILGAYFWGALISRILGSRIGEVIGQRGTIATLTFTTAILELFSPIAASIHPMVLAACRFLIGVSFGPIPASVQSLMSAWAPRNELSSMMTTAFSGATLGGMTGLVFAGWVTEKYGWQFPFWIGGGYGLLFLPFWITLVRNTPQEHPWLSPYERKLLEQNNHITIQKTVPWMKIAKSPYVAILILAQFARSSLNTILTAEGPSFLKYKLGLDLNKAGYVCGGNSLFSMLFMLVYGRASDMLINRNYLSKINTRKLFHFIGTGGSTVILIGFALADCDTTTVIVLWELMGAITIATVCSYMISIIDLAPNYAGTLMGFMAVGNLGSALTPLVVSYLLNKENGWNKTFYLASGISLLSCIFYVAFMTADVQSWNSEKKNEDEKSESAVVTRF